MSLKGCIDTLPYQNAKNRLPVSVTFLVLQFDVECPSVINCSNYTEHC